MLSPLPLHIIDQVNVKTVNIAHAILKLMYDYAQKSYCPPWVDVVLQRITLVIGGLATCYYRSFLSIKFGGKLHDS